MRTRKQRNPTRLGPIRKKGTPVALVTGFTNRSIRKLFFTLAIRALYLSFYIEALDCHDFLGGGGVQLVTMTISSLARKFAIIAQEIIFAKLPLPSVV